MSDDSNERKEESADITASNAETNKPPEAAAAAAQAGDGDTDAEKEAKAQAAAEARAARAAAREARAAAGGQAPATPAADAAASDSAGGDADAEKEAKAKAAAEARAARAAARAGKTDGAGDGTPAEPKPPSPKQPVLDRAVQLIRENVSAEAVVESFINERDRDLPVLSIRSEDWAQTAVFLRDNEELSLNYLRNLSGVDYETHMEVVVYLISLDKKQDYCVKVRTDRNEPSVPSVTPVWETANWQEREVYDLLGIDFPGHPDMRRIMLPDDWVGHPLRKDYEPIDPEV
jgi:NADH-quinone oxidoreductase subunit C